MSCVDSITYAGSMADLKDLNLDEIRLFENYKFKDPADISNNLEIAKFKEQVNFINCTRYIVLIILILWYPLKAFCTDGF